MQQLNSEQLWELIRDERFQDPSVRAAVMQNLSEIERSHVEILERGAGIGDPIMPGPIEKPDSLVNPGEFLSSIVSGTGHAVQGLYEMGKKAGEQGIPAMMMEQGALMVPTIAKQLKQAQSEAQQGGVGGNLRASGRAMATAAGLGPAVEQTEQLFSEGNPSAAIGELIGLFGAPVLGLGAVNRMTTPRPAPGSPAPNMDAILAREPALRVTAETSEAMPARTTATVGEPVLGDVAVRAADVRLSRGQQRNSPSLQKLESFVERSAASGKRPSTFRQQQQGDLFAISDEFGRKVSGYDSDGNPQATGAFVRDAASETMTKIADVTGKEIAEVAAIVEGRPATGPKISVETVTPESVMGLKRAGQATGELVDMQASHPTPDMITRARIELGLEGPLPAPRDTPSAIGAANAKLSRVQQLRQRAVGGIYDAVTKTNVQEAPAFQMSGGGTLVDMAPLQKIASTALQQMRATLSKHGGSLPRNTVLGDEALLQAMVDGGRWQRFSTVQRTRTTLADTLSRNGDLITSPSKGLIKRIVGATSKQMAQAVKRAGGPELRDRFLAANKEWMELRVVQDEMVLGQIAKSDTPERFASMLEAGGTEQVQSAKTFLRRHNPEAWDMLRTQHMRNGLDGAQQGELNMGSTIEAAVRDAGVDVGRTSMQRFSPKAFESWVETMKNNGQLKIWYEPQEIAGFSELIDLSRRALPLGAESGPGITQAAPGLMAGGTDAAIVYGFFTNPAASAGAVAAMRLTARMLFDTKGRSFLRAYANALSEGNTRAAVTYAALFSQRAELIAPREREAALLEAGQ